MIWFWALVIPALLLGVHSLLADRGANAWLAKTIREEQEPAAWPPATVIVPVKGYDHGLEEHLRALATQDYPDYELLVAVQREADLPPGCLPNEATLVVAPPGDPHTGEKIRNLLAAVAAARPESAVFAFADSDGLVAPGWLKALVRPLGRPGIGAATSYRWYTPSPVTFASLLRGLWNGVVAGLFLREKAPFAWGGATAIRREDFHSLDVPAAWRGQVSDDMRLTFAVKRANLSIAYAPQALVASTDTIGFLPLLRWIRRQLIISRVFDPRLFFPAYFATAVYCAGMAAGVVAVLNGRLVGWLALLLQISMGGWKAYRRTRAASLQLPAQRRFFQRWGWVYWTLFPLGTWLWLLGFILASTTNIIAWRGNRYYLSPQGCRKV